MATNPKKVVTPVGLISYAFVFEPQAAQEEGKEPKYSVNIIFPKGEDLTSLKAAAKRAAVDKFGEKIPKKFRWPFRDGDEDREDDELYAESIFIVARSKNQPKVVNEALEPLMDQEEFYSGCYARVSLIAFAYDHPTGGKGVSFALGNIMKVKDGERLSGGSSAEEDFKEFSKPAEKGSSSPDDFDDMGL